MSCRVRFNLFEREREGGEEQRKRDKQTLSAEPDAGFDPMTLTEIMTPAEIN